ncbi:hypothetical protein MTBPR1_200023 [Candidatus Terasakiella magnetica]|uniref:Uncharacterized protein n=1 Tax=Candidatus Terasakiella magnetica TaxID=1867952 RepID=A0A1C3RGW5_9PROT|nr:hypothetical protein [Candidatus Terasakiella magnetica]SCA56543.1 hypothetical protein MTBPR1_200023 [Candidatus Terasakiella magnetica]
MTSQSERHKRFKRINEAVKAEYEEAYKDTETHYQDTDDEQLDRYRLFKDCFDFHAIRAGMMCPRARFSDLDQRIQREEAKREAANTEPTSDEIQRLKISLFEECFAEATGYLNDIEHTWTETIEQIFADEKKVRDLLKQVEEKEYAQEVQEFNILLQGKDYIDPYIQMKEAVESGQKISVDIDKWHMIQLGKATKTVDKIIEQRTDQGFMIAQLFWYMLRANMYHKDKQVPDTRSKYTDATVFQHYADGFLKDVTFPGCQEPRAINKNTLPIAKRKMWPSAHLWAALYGQHFDKSRALENDVDSFLKVIKKADALHKLAMKHDVYELIVPKSYIEEMVLTYEGIEGNPDDIEVDDFNSDEITHIEEYISTQSPKVTG